MGIVIGDEIREHDGLVFLQSVSFPKGWYTEKNGEYWVTYYDGADQAKFMCFAKMTPYERKTLGKFMFEEKIE